MAMTLEQIKALPVGSRFIVTRNIHWHEHDAVDDDGYPLKNDLQAGTLVTVSEVKKPTDLVWVEDVITSVEYCVPVNDLLPYVYAGQDSDDADWNCWRCYADNFDMRCYNDGGVELTRFNSWSGEMDDFFEGFVPDLAGRINDELARNLFFATTIDCLERTGKVPTHWETEEEQS